MGKWRAPVWELPPDLLGTDQGLTICQGGLPVPADFSEKLRVLVADDNHDAADTLAILLQLCGCEVCVSYDGLSALRAVPRFKPHVALLDVMMPKVHGAEVARRLRQSAAADEAPLLVATSGADPADDRLESYEGVFDAYLVKPYSFDEIHELLTAQGV
jgi:CheY-like chemotaxis protein